MFIVESFIKCLLNDQLAPTNYKQVERAVSEQPEVLMAFELALVSPGAGW